MTELHTITTGDARPPHPLVTADRVNGTTVYGASGEKLGKVEDIAIDKISGEVAYAILGAGGFLGLGERYYPLAWRTLTYDPDRRGYVVPGGRAELEAAPSLNADELSGWRTGGDWDVPLMGPG